MVQSSTTRKRRVVCLRRARCQPGLTPGCPPGQPLALLLVSVGVYGVMTYSMAQRTHEFGIRMALGARTSHVFRVVLGEAFVLIAIGAGLGLAAALVLARHVESFLYGLSGRDPLAYVAVTAVLIATALLAGFVPARRATELDPVTALRYE